MNNLERVARAIAADFGKPTLWHAYEGTAKKVLAALAAMAGWQSMDSAPVGVPVLVYGDWYGEINGRFEESPFSAVAERTRDGGYWGSVAADAYGCWCEPTRWQPLPEPPRTES